MPQIDTTGMDLQEKVVDINRVSKVVKGGRRLSLTALVVVGDGAGHVGVGYGKGREVPVAINKAINVAKKNLFEVPLADSTIPYEVMGRYGAGRVMLKPAAPGTGIIAGGAVRALMELAGITDILSKSLGSDNQMNVLKAAAQGLQSLKAPEDIATLRDKPVNEVRA